MKGLKSQLYF